jgi:hypothetical protein
MSFIELVARVEGRRARRQRRRRNMGFFILSEMRRVERREKVGKVC